jgi:hypothetical protein
MTREPDIQRAAKHLIEVYGRNAAHVAEKRARNIDSDNAAAAQTWRRIAGEVRAIQVGDPLIPA